MMFFPFFSDSGINHKVHALVVDELTVFWVSRASLMSPAWKKIVLS